MYQKTKHKVHILLHPELGVEGTKELPRSGSGVAAKERLEVDRVTVDRDVIALGLRNRWGRCICLARDRRADGAALPFHVAVKTKVGRERARRIGSRVPPDKSGGASPPEAPTVARIVGEGCRFTPSLGRG